jgi:PEP-CTERM motif
MGGTLLADFTTSGNASNSATFASQTKIYILKDIEQSNANAFISSFVNSHEVATPEPASLSMMGLGLLGLGLVGRRKRKV